MLEEINKVYSYNNHGVYVGIDYAQIDIATGELLMPANATLIEPIQCGNDEFIAFKNKEWKIYKKNPIGKYYNKTNPREEIEVEIYYLNAISDSDILIKYTNITPDIPIINGFSIFDDVLAEWGYKDTIATIVSNIEWGDVNNVHNIDDIKCNIAGTPYNINKIEQPKLYNIIMSSILLKPTIDNMILSRLRDQKKDELSKKLQDMKDNIFLQYGTFKVKDNILTIQEILRNKSNYKTSFVYNIPSKGISLTKIPVSYTQTLGVQVENYRSYMRVFRDTWESIIDATPAEEIKNITFTPIKMLNLNMEDASSQEEDYILFGIDNYFTITIEINPVIKIVKTTI